MGYKSNKRDLEKIELMVHLLLVDEPGLTNEQIIINALEEFGEHITEEDLKVLYASYLPDNFEAESKLIEYYG